VGIDDPSQKAIDHGIGSGGWLGRASGEALITALAFFVATVAWC